MSDDFFRKPPDLRSLPEHLRNQAKSIAPLRHGEVHATVTMHNHQYKGTTMPTARLWVEPYEEIKAPFRKGTLFSIYDPTGHRLIVTARLLDDQSLTTLVTLAQTYLRQDGDAVALRNALYPTPSPLPVILESPYAGDVERNVAYAQACMRDALQRGEAPYASHLLYTQPNVLDDLVPAERTLGIEAGLAIGSLFTKTVVYTDHGLSGGMQYGIDRANAAGREIEYRKLYKEDPHEQHT